MGIRIAGVGAYVPEQDASPITSWPRRSTRRTNGSPPRPASSSDGSRRPERRPATWAVRRPLRCLSHAGVDKSAVDLIVVACATPDQSQPAVACLVQEKLGIAERPVPGVRRELGLRRLRVRAERRAEHDAGGRRRSIATCWSSAPTRSRRSSTGTTGGPASSSATAPGRCCCRRPTATSGASTSGWAATAGAAAASRSRPAARACPVDAEVLEKRLNTFVDGRAQGLGLRRRTPCPRTIRALLARARAGAARPRPAGPAPEQPAHDRGHHEVARAARWSGPSPPSRPTATRRPPASRSPCRRPGRPAGCSPARASMLCGFGGGLSWGAALLDW